MRLSSTLYLAGVLGAVAETAGVSEPNGGTISSSWETWKIPTKDTEPYTVTLTTNIPTYITITETYHDTIYVTRMYTDTTTLINTETQLKVITNIESFTDTETAYQTDTHYQTETQHQTDTYTATNTVVSEISDTITAVETAISLVTTTIFQDIPGPTLTRGNCPTGSVKHSSGITLCPSRIINIDYTPPTPLPSTYMFGCPPGSLCKPKQVDCNFEVNPPADTYFCDPQDCEQTTPYPVSLDNLEALENANTTCAWYTPIDDYFNLDPRNWNLDYAIFDIYGQPKCPPAAPAATPAPVTVISTVIQPSPTSIIVTTTLITTVKSSAGWSPWSQSTHAAPAAPSSVSAGWQNWEPSKSTPWSSGITQRAELVERVPLDLPASCYGPCNQINIFIQSVGFNSSALCGPSQAFSEGLITLSRCLTRYSAQGDRTAATLIASADRYCSSFSTATG